LRYPRQVFTQNPAAIAHGNQRFLLSSGAVEKLKTSQSAWFYWSKVGSRLIVFQKLGGIIV